MATTKTTKQTAQEPSATSQKNKQKTPSAAAKTTPKKAPADAPPTPATPAPKPASKKPAVAKVDTKTATVSKTKAPEVVPPLVAASVSVSKWEEIRSILLNMKEQTLLEIKRSIKKGSEASVGEEPTGDIYDQASSERDRELGLLLNDREREKLHNIDEALLRITDGEYGLCEECDEEIPMGRLKVLPFTRHCVRCKSDLEKFQAQTRRIEEDRAYREIPGGDDDEG
jgi:DnaK suppressor protein